MGYTKDIGHTHIVRDKTGAKLVRIPKRFALYIAKILKQ